MNGNNLFTEAKKRLIKGPNYFRPLTTDQNLSLIKVYNILMLQIQNKLGGVLHPFVLHESNSSTEFSARLAEERGSVASRNARTIEQIQRCV
jgi:hypothetical protein